MPFHTRTHTNYCINLQVYFLSDGNIGQEHQHVNHVPSSTPKMGEHLDPNSNMELVGHSIVRPVQLSLSQRLHRDTYFNFNQ